MQRFEFYLYKTLPNEPYLFFDLNEEIKDKDNVKVIDAFVRAHADVLSPEENFLCIDRYTGKIFRQQAMYVLLDAACLA
jgi:hypothetical protein